MPHHAFLRYRFQGRISGGCCPHRTQYISIYRYGEIAYIGGGFGVGIHNVLEAAVYGMPVIFGPNNKRFREAQGLLQCKGGFEIQGAEDFKKIMDNFLNNYEALDKAGKKAGNYVRDNAGALEKIMHTVTL